MTAAYWFWVDASRERSKPCGAVGIDRYGKVVDGAPWFRYHWRGKMFRECVRRSGAKYKQFPS